MSVFVILCWHGLFIYSLRALFGHCIREGKYSFKYTCLKCGTCKFSLRSCLLLSVDGRDNWILQTPSLLLKCRYSAPNPATWNAFWARMSSFEISDKCVERCTLYDKKTENEETIGNAVMYNMQQYGQVHRRSMDMYKSLT